MPTHHRTNPQRNVCSTCSVRIPKNRPKLICSICNHIRHFRCQKLSKAEAQHIIDQGEAWICYECISGILPINACLSVIKSNCGPKFRVQCGCCSGWSHSPNNTRICTWCCGTVHLKCYRYDLGCIKCCENLIPGYHVTSFELDENYSKINNLVYNPYDHTHFTSLIGSAIDNEELNNDYWNEISELLVNCKYKQQRHVRTPSHNELKILSLNIRSLPKNIVRLREEINTYNEYDIICFNETCCLLEKLANGVNDILLDGFYEPLLQAPARKSGKGGGLAVYINKRVCEPDNFENFTVNLNSEDTDRSGEFQFIKIHNCKGFNKTKIIVNVYRSPANKKNRKFL